MSRERELEEALRMIHELADDGLQRGDYEQGSNMWQIEADARAALALPSSPPAPDKLRKVLREHRYKAFGRFVCECGEANAKAGDNWEQWFDHVLGVWEREA